ncbi:helix-turn-helix domain-containing protein [Phaeacidiphilus oryzae]|uniref:helix-turn-helix domain-containing protein n=1 Tax=Phaeacidiphilus oryzae TaxID=348818 RepID=UPI00068F86F5|nr:helix-turn-helix domain-containing protein [Phaeacidiphilus oryzae]
MTGYTPPRPLPADVLEREDVRSALAAHDFGEFFQLARKWGGISFNQIAEACGMTPSRVGVVAKGKGRIPTIDKIKEICDGLRIPGMMVGLLPRPWENEGIKQLSLPNGTHPGAHGGEDFAQSIRGMSRQLLDLDVQLGGMSVADAAVRAFKKVHDRIGQSAPDDLGSDTLAAASELAEVAGWVLFDAEKHGPARRFNQEALYLARLSGDRAMELLILQNMAMQAGWNGRYSEELAVARSVLEQGKLSPRVESMFRVREARGLAHLGDLRAAEKSFSRAESLTQESLRADDPAWSWWVTRGEIGGHHGWSLVRHGEMQQAVPLLESSAHDQSETGYQLIFLVRLLDASLRAQAWSEAASVAAEIMPMVRETGSARSLNVLRETLQREDNYDKAPASLRDALSHIKDVLGRDPYEIY